MTLLCESRVVGGPHAAGAGLSISKRRLPAPGSGTVGALVLGDQLRIKARLTVARHLQLDLAGIGDDPLFAIAVSPVARLLAGEMMVHLGVGACEGSGTRLART
jgi:hypothetical protein